MKPNVNRSMVLVPLLLLAGLLVPLVSLDNGKGGDPPPHDAGFQPMREELTYEVSYWFIKLGTIRLRVEDVARDNNTVTMKAKADIDTYSGLIVANLHVVFESMMDGEYFSESFTDRTQDGDHWRVTKYAVDDRKRLVYIERGRSTERKDGTYTLEKNDTTKIDSKIQDGLSIFYFARANVKSGRTQSVMTIAEHSKGNTVLNFSGERTGVDCDLVEYPVDCVELHGTAEFNGIFGFTGKFAGWFSNDEARIPILGKVNVLLGSVKLRLIHWDRPGWVPPRAAE